MRKRLKIVSLLTALALLGGLLGGCGKSSRIETDSVAVQETTDPLLAEHQKQLEQLNSSYPICYTVYCNKIPICSEDPLPRCIPIRYFTSILKHWINDFYR